MNVTVNVLGIVYFRERYVEYLNSNVNSITGFFLIFRLSDEMIGGDNQRMCIG